MYKFYSVGERSKGYLDAIPNAAVHVVRNGHAGEGKNVDLYNTSKLRKDVEDRGGRSVTFPDLADRVSDGLYSKRLSIAKASNELPIGNRAELLRWRGEVKKAFEGCSRMSDIHQLRKAAQAATHGWGGPEFSL